MSVEEELARKRARTRAFLPKTETGTTQRSVEQRAKRETDSVHERVRPNERVRPAGLADGGHVIPPRKEVVG